MEVMYRNNFDGYASCNTFLDDGFDSGPLFYSEDPETGFYHMFQNPMWVEEKPQIILFSDFLNWYEPVDYKKTLDWLFYNKEIGIGKKLASLGLAPVSRSQRQRSKRHILSVWMRQPSVMM